MMKALMIATLAVAAAIGTANWNPAVRFGETSSDSNAAFRDGLYLGKLDAQHSRESHLAVGRWAAASDQASFTKGYSTGYERISLARR